MTYGYKYKCMNTFTYDIYFYIFKKENVKSLSFSQNFDEIKDES